MSLARMAHASALRMLQSQLGPPSSELTSTNSRAEIWKLQTDRNYADNAEGERMLGDTAGVGAIVTSNSTDAVLSATTATISGLVNIDATLREQLLKPSSRTKHAVQQSTRNLGVHKSNMETRRHEDEISSEDDQGRSSLGQPRSLVNREKPAGQPRKKKARTEVETFEGMQSKTDDPIKKEDPSDEAETLVPPAKAPTRSKSYLDEALEARHKKQQRKKMKKEKQNSVQ